MNYPSDTEDVSAKAMFLQDAMLEAVDASSTERTLDFPDVPTEVDDEIKDLITRRREIKVNEIMNALEKQQLRVVIRKRIQNLIRKRLAQRKDVRIKHVLPKFRDLSRLRGLKGRSTKASIVEV